LKAETVQDLNRLKDETGQASLNDLVVEMIRLTDAYRHDDGVIAPLGRWQLPLP
jgi:hypothetical protein